MRKLKMSIAEGNLLNAMEMGGIFGGSCGCACAYAGRGGSSTADNSAANGANDLHSPGMVHQDWEMDEDGGWIPCDHWL